ncbi:MAG: sugar ABC transporter permease [Planctomycetes bacterium]|nr:sugar ABC transporter permease [Planctomycetota bacterium]
MSEPIIPKGGGFQGWLTRARFTTVLWMLMIPAMAGLIAFTYIPNIESVIYSFYKWDGAMIEEYIGVENFREAFRGDPRFWGTFLLILILLAANLVKMWPSIFAAIVLHRMKSEKSQYLYRVMFVIPMVIPGLVALLLWKSFFDANVGIFNGFLRATGMMDVLAWADHAWPAMTAFMNGSVMHWNDGGSMAVNVLTLPFKAITAFFGGPWGLALWGGLVLMLARGVKPFAKLWLLWPLIGALAFLAWGDGPVTALLRGVPLALAAWGVGAWLRARDIHEAPTRIAWLGWACVAVGVILVMVTKVWTHPTNAFDLGRPAWLGHSQLVLPAVILWGFPWIGTVGVLIYLAGLSNISQEVYEAAELDGVGFWGKIFRIEVPLIMTQVRINLIFLTIGTLNDYAFFLILLGPSGGPDGAGLTPGLYMYQQAFVNGRLGYACALGMVMFLIILYITVFYQRHVKVDK